MTSTASIRATTGADVRLGHSKARSPDTAIQELAQQISQPNPALVALFVSPGYKLAELGAAIATAFPNCPVVGCTTSGELSPLGYAEESLTGFSLSGTSSRVKTFALTNLKDLNPGQIQDIKTASARHIVDARTTLPDSRDFAVMFIDGMSGAEEQTVALMHQALGGIPLIGGSAGDNLMFQKTWVYANGRFHTDAAVCALISTSLPFETFKTQHFVPTDTKLVITEADPTTRTVYEINGLPAAEEYARLIGIEPDALVPAVFSKYPVMLRIGGEYYVRSLQKKNPDGSLRFYCAIDNGLVLTLGQGVDIVQNLRTTLKDVAGRIHQPQLLITCECVLRRLEVLQKGLQDQVGDVLRQHHAVGFHSYGEQFNAVHVNQTFSGVMIGQLP